MVNYKVRVFCEPEDEDSLGAEVRIYSEDGDDPIDTILITTESQYRELAEKIENIDDTYIDMNELITLLNGGTLNINANTLNGINSNGFAKLNHNDLHQGVFAPVKHDSTSDKYGLATSNSYGHVKTIDNLTTASNISGEALSANQGRVLNELINTVKSDLRNWTSQAAGSYGKLEINRALRLCSFSYYRENYNIRAGVKTLHEDTSIKNYPPPHSATSAADNYILKVTPEGDIKIYADANHNDTTIIGYWFWKY